MRRARACSGSGEQTSSPEGLDKRLVEVVVTATIVGVATRGGRVDYRPSVCCGRECRVRGLGDVKARSHAGGHAMRGRWARGWYRSGCANDDAGCGRESRLGREGAPAGQGRIKAHQEDAAAYGLARIGHHDRFNLNNNTTKPSMCLRVQLGDAVRSKIHAEFGAAALAVRFLSRACHRDRALDGNPASMRGPALQSTIAAALQIATMQKGHLTTEQSHRNPRLARDETVACS
jgi:hypothetical protein